MRLNAKAFLFDMNGTIINDMFYHVVAWQDILNNELKAGLTTDQVKVEMYGKNSDVLTRVFGEGYFTEEQMQKISMEKEKRYQTAYLPELRLIDGLQKFLDEAKEAGVLMAIGSAAITFNIDFVVDNLHLRKYFPIIVGADDVNLSKPHPETFLMCAKLLSILPEDCIVFEDAPKGVEAAKNAGMRAFVLTTMHNKHEFEKYDNVVGFADNYLDLHVEI